MENSLSRQGSIYTVARTMGQEDMRQRRSAGKARNRQGTGEGKACGRGAASKVGDESGKGLWRSHR